LPYARGRRSQPDGQRRKEIRLQNKNAVERGVEVSGVQVLDGDTSRLTRGGEDLDNVGFVFFGDPDGNGWAVQQIPARD
jgi:hypothetical protein